ncbi:YfmQ family protein [Bacillus massiliglaciei]|uniref:YfmQ family protein n=1 Tax=Bacillus massiliglaciei TaxID=1816693 RepID=UPI000DA5EFAD|nr:YfmQ family protein [Bacillus massiliglaciei]
MTITVLIVTIVLSLIKLLATCLPTDVVNWILRKFELHAELHAEETQITMEGKLLDGDEKTRVIDSFNEAIFLKQKHIFPGNESMFLEPEDGGTPIIIDTKQGKKDIRLTMFIYSDRVDVVKQYKKKVLAYSLLSDSLQERFMPAGAGQEMVLN